MTTRTSCCALYDSHLDLSLAHHSLGTLVYYDPGGDAGPEAGNHGKYSY